MSNLADTLNACLPKTVKTSGPILTTRSINESFMKRAGEACFFEAWVGAVLCRCGLYVKHLPMVIAQNRQDLKTMGYSWDLEVSPDELIGERVEVKSTQQWFDSILTYPDKDVFVCSQSNFNKKWPNQNKTGSHFLFVSKKTGNIVWLPKGSVTTQNVVRKDYSRGETFKAVTATSSKLKSLEAFVEVMNGLKKK